MAASVVGANEKGQRVPTLPTYSGGDDDGGLGISCLLKKRKPEKNAQMKVSLFFYSRQCSTFSFVSLQVQYIEGFFTS